MCSSVVQIIVLCLLLTRLSLIFRSQRPTRSKRTVSFQVQRDLIASVWKFCDICQPWPDSHMWWWRKICSLALEACGGLIRQSHTNQLYDKGNKLLSGFLAVFPSVCPRFFYSCISLSVAGCSPYFGWEPWRLWFCPVTAVFLCCCRDDRVCVCVFASKGRENVRGLNAKGRRILKKNVQRLKQRRQKTMWRFVGGLYVGPKRRPKTGKRLRANEGAGWGLGGGTGEGDLEDQQQD